jgi:hypothetical protein
MIGDSMLSGVFIRKSRCTCQGNFCLGCIVAASGSVIWQDLHTKTIEMPLQWPEIPLPLENDNNCSHYPVEGCIRKNIWTCWGNAGFGLNVTSSGSVIWQDLHTKTIEMHLEGSGIPLVLQNDHYCLHYRLGVCIRWSCEHTRGMLVLDGLLHPLLPLFY